VYRRKNAGAARPTLLETNATERFPTEAKYPPAAVNCHRSPVILPGTRSERANAMLGNGADRSLDNIAALRGRPTARLASYKSVKPSLVFILWSNIVHNWDIRRPHSPSHLPELNFVRQGTAMAKIKYQYFDANSGIGQTDLANHAIGSLDYGNSHGLRYSSPWPWIFAISISLAMWASIGWIIWVFVR
jgi:hypothetical protein